MSAFNLMLMYFDAKVGPDVILSLPGKAPPELVSTVQAYFNTQAFKETVEPITEVILKEKNTKLLFAPFKLTSCWARGGHELAMISVATDERDRTEKYHNILKDIPGKFSSHVNIFKGFYNPTHKADPEIPEKKKELLQVFTETFDVINEKRNLDADKNPVVQKFKRVQW